jgi:hypothetical protein
MEKKIHEVLNYVWAMSGKIDPEKFLIGVSKKGWKTLGASEDTTEMTINSYGRVFKVFWIEDLPEDSVALVWP